MRKWNEGIIAVAGCAAVIAGLYFTKDANCLWALILVACMIGTAN